MKKRVVSLALALCVMLTLLPTAAWAAKPMDGETGGRAETAETPPEAAEHPSAPRRTVKDAADSEPETDESLRIEVAEPDAALQDAGYSVVLTLPGEWDSYDWQLWSGEADGGWTSLDATDAALPLTKELFVSFAFRCVVEKDGETVASAPYAYFEEALTEPLGAMAELLGGWGLGFFNQHWKDSDYIAVAPPNTATTAALTSTAGRAAATTRRLL